MSHSKWIVPVIAVFAVAAGACGEDPSSPHLEPAIVGPLATACTGTDPNPTAPGVYLGACTPSYCAQITDHDQDGLGTLCEELLAWFFAPELAYDSRDNVGREPHWVARLDDPFDNRVWLGYLLSYYVDWGAYDPPFCSGNLCRGHAGDSEAIFLLVAYNSSTQHWVLERAFYSQHGGYGAYGPGPNGYPSQLYYPSRVGAHPRAYVATYKHANYSTDHECDTGGTFGSDECNPSAYARVYAGVEVNLGSRAHPAQDCVPSSNPFHADNGVIECYWTERRFSGWQGFQPDSDPYSPKLGAFFF